MCFPLIGYPGGFVYAAFWGMMQEWWGNIMVNFSDRISVAINLGLS